MLIEFEADPKVIHALQGLGAHCEIAVPANGAVGYACITMDRDLDAQIVDLIDRLVELRLAYIDSIQRGLQLPLFNEMP